MQENHIEDEGIVDLDEVPDLAEPLSGGKKGKKKRDSTALRKAPQAPKRFKSSYICFFMAKQPEIKAELGEDATVTSISKRSAEMWKHLPPEERAHWDDVAAKDKQRYMNEKATYTGPWQVPWKRVKKDPSGRSTSRVFYDAGLYLVSWLTPTFIISLLMYLLTYDVAPRRPMSAFLFYSIGKRQQIKEENPQMKNTEISRVLGEMWRSLSEEERRPFVEKEKTEREKYKVAIAEWRKTSRAKQEAQRKAAMEQQQNLMSGMHEQPVMYPDHYGAPAIPVFYPGYPAYGKRLRKLH